MARVNLKDVSRLFQAPPPARRGGQQPPEERERTASGGVAALDHVTLTVPNGKTCAIVGPSGCGKSTLLRVVAGLDMDYTGDLYYDERNMRDVPPRDRYIGMVFQNYALYPHFHGHSNLMFSFWMRKAPDAEAEERIRVTSEMMGFGFSQLLGRKPGTLSGGEQQRLAIARALVRQPKLFLLDEPLASLDAKLRMQTRVEIKRLLKRFAITTFYVTHDQVEALALADMIAVMQAGRIEQIGPANRLRDDPTNAFVAGFFGSYPMNMLSGVVDGEGTLFLAGAGLPLVPSVRAQCRPEQSITLGVRPEALSLVLPHTAPGEGIHISGEVESIEPDFAHRTQYVRLHTEVGVLTVADSSNEPLALTQRVTVAIPPDPLYFFDTESGRRIRA